MPDKSSDTRAASFHRSKIYYGWVIVIVCTLAVAIAYGTMYSYSVFFKPLAGHFNWDRATVSAIYSVSLILRGATSIGIGWLADKYGAKKLMAFCGFMIGLGLILSSQVTELWQLYLTYGLIEAAGLGGAFTIGTAITSRWFTRNRGMALGIVASGSGMGTLILVPLAERLISTFDWSMTFLIVGISAGIIVTSTAFLLKPVASVPLKKDEGENQTEIVRCAGTGKPIGETHQEITFRNAALSKEMIMLCLTYFFLLYCVQMIMVHLVNYATDTGISPLQAAGFVSIIGAVSIAGRLLMGRASDKIGVTNSLLICGILAIISIIILPFITSSWEFILFAVIFGFAYGGEIPQMPMFISHFFGIRAMAALMGILTFVSNIGGALGSWSGGITYDVLHNYQLAFAVAGIASLGAIIMALVLKRYDKRNRGHHF